MGKTNSFKTYSDELYARAEYSRYADDVKNVKRGNKKRISKHTKYQPWEEDSY